MLNMSNLYDNIFFQNFVLKYFQICTKGLGQSGRREFFIFFDMEIVAENPI